jgi:hypothetical protein
MKKSNNSIIGVLDAINEEPKKFFKKLAPYYRQECYETIIKPYFIQLEETWVIEEIEGEFKGYKDRIYIANMVRCLMEKYPFDSFEYKSDNFVTVAKKLKRKYGERITKYMGKKFHPEKVVESSPDGRTTVCYHTRLEAFKELVFRGFVPIEFTKFDIKSDFFIKSDSFGGLVWPEKKFTTQHDALQLLSKMQIGITGFTGVNTPKKWTKS